MYYINNLKLISKYLKSIIPLDKKLLTYLLDLPTLKDNEQTIATFLTQSSEINPQFAASIQQAVDKFIPFLELNLILDAWYNGVEYAAVKNTASDKFINSIQTQQNLIIDTQQALSQENYDLLQRAITDNINQKCLKT